MDDRETMSELVNAMAVSDAELFDPIYSGSPVLAKLMFDKFKHFLDNDYFTDLERQSLLIRFLETQNGVLLIKDLLSFINTCKHKDDYNTIVLEWTFHNSESIIQTNLSMYDGEFLAFTKQQMQQLKNTKNNELSEDEIKNMFKTITDTLLKSFQDNNNDSEDGGDMIG